MLLVNLSKVGKDYGGNLVFDQVDLEILEGERIGLIGENGSGKTTLLKTIMPLVPPDSGTIQVGASVVMGYYAQEQETLPPDQTPPAFVRSLKPMSEQAAVKFLRRLLFFYPDVHTPIGDLSGGEKSRLQIARLMLTDANFLLLDEPTNNLDIASSEVLEAALEEFDGTILAVSHDRYFLDKIVTTIVAIGDDGEVQLYPGNFSYYHERTSS